MASLSAKLVVSGLAKPLFATAPPGDVQRLFIVEQVGRIRILNLVTGQLVPQPFLQVTGLSSGSEQGLLGLAFHPSYANNGFFYVNFTDAAGTTVIKRFQVSTNDPNVADPNGQVVLTVPQPFANHNGGWVAFGPDGMLYIGMGDGGSGNDPQNRAQNLGELLGKMLRIDVNGDDFPADPNRNYAIPPSNPFVNRAGARAEIWAFGLRNPWRNCFDRQTGDLYMGDVGQNNFEEVNFQRAASQGGENYGWRAKEGKHPTPTLPAPDPNPPGVIDPIHEYSHDDGSAIIGGYVYRGAKIAGLQGTYFFGDLDGRIWSFRWNGGAVTDFAERSEELTPSGESISGLTSFGEDAAGELYFMTLGGKVFAMV